MWIKSLALLTAVSLPLTAPAIEQPKTETELADPAKRIRELESRVDQLQKELQAVQLERLTARWRLVAIHNETRKSRLRVGSLLDIQFSKLSLDRAPGTLEVAPDGSLKLVFADGEVRCRPSILGEYLKLGLPDGTHYFFQKLAPSGSSKSS